MSDKKKTRNNNIQKEKLPPYLIVMGAVCVVMAVITIIVSVVMAQREPIVEFIPPVFETDAVTGIHDISEIVECADIDADELCDDCGYELPHDHD